MYVSHIFMYGYGTELLELDNNTWNQIIRIT